MDEKRNLFYCVRNRLSGICISGQSLWALYAVKHVALLLSTFEKKGGKALGGDLSGVGLGFEWTGFVKTPFVHRTRYAFDTCNYIGNNRKKMCVKRTFWHWIYVYFLAHLKPHLRTCMYTYYICNLYACTQQSVMARTFRRINNSN